MGFACLADIASMQYQPVVRYGYFFLRDVLYQLTLGLQRGFAVMGQPYAMGEAWAMEAASG